MDAFNIGEAAAILRAARGDKEALSYVTAQAIECHLIGDEEGRIRWQAIVAELRFLIRPPQTSMLDIYRAAHILLGTHGEAEALRVLDERTQTIGPMHAGLHPLLAAAVRELARREPGWEELVQ